MCWPACLVLPLLLLLRRSIATEGVLGRVKLGVRYTKELHDVPSTHNEKALLTHCCVFVAPCACVEVAAAPEGNGHIGAHLCAE